MFGLKVSISAASLFLDFPFGGFLDSFGCAGKSHCKTKLDSLVADIAFSILRHLFLSWLAARTWTFRVFLILRRLNI